MAKFEDIVDAKLTKTNSFVIATHNQQLINKFCNRTTYLEKVKIMKDEQIKSCKFINLIRII